MRLLSLVTAGAVLASGCYQYTAIKPSELPKLTGPTVGVTSSGNAVAVATRTVERPDGRVVEIRGGFDIVMDLGRGGVTLEGPIVATVDGERLLVKSANRSPIETAVADVRTVEVKQVDRAKSNLASLLGGFAAAGVITALLWVAVGAE